MGTACATGTMSVFNGAWYEHKDQNNELAALVFWHYWYDIGRNDGPRAWTSQNLNLSLVIPLQQHPRQPRQRLPGTPGGQRGNQL